MPEICAQRKAIADWRSAGNSIDLFFSLHNTETAEYLEGPAGPLAERFFATLKRQTTFDPTRPLSVVAPNRERAGQRGAGPWPRRRDSGVPDGAADR